MTARILVVDDIIANVRLLEAKLTAEYFEVQTAMNGADALEILERQPADIVLLDVMMPGMDGIEVCRRIKANPSLQHIPVILVTALDQPEDRLRGLEAGADDFLTKPVNDLALFCRVKSLVRLKMITDELRARATAGPGLVIAGGSVAPIISHDPAQILVIDNRGTLADRIRGTLGERHAVTVADQPQQAVFSAAEGRYEVIIVNLGLEGFDGLRLCSQLRSLERTRQVPIIVILDASEHERLIRALDMGVNDYLLRPVERQELLARVNTQVKRWRYTELLRQNVSQSLEAALTDALTGLFNRRYLESRLKAIADGAANRGKNLAVLAIDADHFKSVNDTYGHEAGDKVLQELARRIRGNVRSADLPCRVGGEEFVVAMPGVSRSDALIAAERLREVVASAAFDIGRAGGPLPVTISVGVAAFEGGNDTAEELLKRADAALYCAKNSGRNRVAAAA